MSQHLTTESAPDPSLSAESAARAPLVVRWREIVVVSALALLAILPYLNALHNEFVFDDKTQVLNDPYIRSFQYLRTIFTSTVFSYAGAGGATNYYRPMMHVLYLLCARLFGLYPRPFHAANILLHAAVVIVLFKATKGLFKDRVLAIVAAALFALHPIHNEAVVWVAAVPDLEVTLFYLLTFWAFLMLPGRERLVRAPAYLSMIVLFVLALFSKESAVTFPVLATLYEHFYRDDRAQTRWTQKISRYAPLWVLAICYVLFRVRVLGGFLPAGILREMPYVDVLPSAIALTGQYVWLFVWPVKLCAAYIFPFGLGAMLPSIAWGFAILLLLTWVFLFLRKRARPVCFGLLWFLVTLSPVLNARWVRNSTSALPFAERYLYLPSVGLCWVVAWGFSRLFEKTSGRAPAWRRGLVSAAALVAALCVVRIVVRNRDWHDDVTFYNRTLALAPNSFEMHNNLGAVYYNQGNMKAAEREWVRAQQISPLEIPLLDNLGLVYMDEGRYDEAISVLKKSILLMPGDADAYINLGMTYAKMGNLPAAENEFGRALGHAPLSVRAHNRLGELYFAEGKYANAAKEFSRSAQSVPTTKAYLGAGLAHLQMGELEQAERAFKAAEALDPGDSRPHFVLGYFYGVNGRTAEAVKEYQAGFKLDPNNEEARATFQQLQAGNAGAKPQ